MSLCLLAAVPLADGKLAKAPDTIWKGHSPYLSFEVESGVKFSVYQVRFFDMKKPHQEAAYGGILAATQEMPQQKQCLLRHRPMLGKLWLPAGSGLRLGQSSCSAVEEPLAP